MFVSQRCPDPNYTPISHRENNHAMSMTTWPLPCAFVHRLDNNGISTLMSVMVPEWLTMRDTLWLKSLPMWQQWCQYITQSHWDLRTDTCDQAEYIPRIMYTVFTFCCVLLWWGTMQFYPYPLWLLHWYRGNHMIGETGPITNHSKTQQSMNYVHNSWDEEVKCVYMWSVYPYPSGLLHWHWGNHMIPPVPVKQPWRIWANDLYESTNNSKHNHNKTRHNKIMCTFHGIHCITRMLIHMSRYIMGPCTDLSVPGQRWLYVPE